MDRFTGYVGTYHSSRSQGIYRFFWTPNPVN